MNINATLFAQAVVFALSSGSREVIWPLLQDKIDARQKTIADGLAAAEQDASRSSCPRARRTRKSAKRASGPPKSSASGKATAR